MLFRWGIYRPFGIHVLGGVGPCLWQYLSRVSIPSEVAAAFFLGGVLPHGSPLGFLPAHVSFLGGEEIESKAPEGEDGGSEEERSLRVPRGGEVGLGMAPP